MKHSVRILAFALAVCAAAGGAHAAGVLPQVPTAATVLQPEQAPSFFEAAFSVFDVNRLSLPIGSAPVAENLELETYKNVPLSGRFSAVDPDGDAVTFQLTDRPARGEVTIDPENPDCFLYSPYENKTGKDSFSYAAIDAAGNVSQPATVRITIQKPSTKVFYADLTDSENVKYQRAAIRLAEEEILVGECMGGTYLFHPDLPVSRGNFLSAALTTFGVDRLSTVAQTGFADDGVIPVWAKPYAATGLKLGAVRGLRNGAGQIIFSSDTTITLAEASVMLNRLLRISDVPASASFAQQHTAPAWAYQATANLTACGVLPHPTATTLSATLTRGEMANLLCAALDFSASRNHSFGL